MAIYTKLITVHNLTIYFAIFQIDSKVIPAEDHTNLSHSLPELGDRIALFTFCERSQPLKDRASKRTFTVLNRLREKLKLISSNSNATDPSSESDGSMDCVRTRVATGQLAC